MKFLFDLFPVILFFSMFKWGQSHPDAAQALAQQYMSGLAAGNSAGISHAPIMLATAIAILATFAQIGYLLIRRRKVDTMLWVSFAIITLFGGATLYFNNETFIKWKPTVFFWSVGTALLLGQAVFGKNLIRLMMEKQLSLPNAVWLRLNFSWAAFFSAMGLINLYVAYHFSTAFWVDFKLFGITGLMIVFVIAQSLFLSKYVKDPQ